MSVMMARTPRARRAARGDAVGRTMRKSPSLLYRAVSTMDALHAYMWTASPDLVVGSPLPAMVRRPSSQSTRGGSSAAAAPAAAASRAGGSGSGSQRSWLGSTVACAKSAASPACAMGTRRLCITDGRTRYSHARWLRWRGAVKALPDSCSAYRPYGQRWGAFWPTGSAPGSASLACSAPNPDRYSSRRPATTSWCAPGAAPAAAAALCAVCPADRMAASCEGYAEGVLLCHHRDVHHDHGSRADPSAHRRRAVCQRAPSSLAWRADRVARCDPRAPPPQAAPCSSGRVRRGPHTGPPPTPTRRARLTRRVRRRRAPSWRCPGSPETTAPRAGPRSARPPCCRP